MDGPGRTWKWRSGLSIYCGDMVSNQLISNSLLTPDQAARLQTDPEAAFADPAVQRALQILASHSGLPPVDGSKVIELHRKRKGDFGWARGRRVTAFDHFCGEHATHSLGALGGQSDIKFRFDTDFAWHPVESQRALMYAGRFGKQEEFVDALARRHFEEATSVNHRTTLTSAAREVGIDVVGLEAYLDGDQGIAEVWASYRDTTERHGIHSIPYFVFNGPYSNGGPFHGGSGGHTVRGSGNPSEFENIFNNIRTERPSEPKALTKAPTSAAQPTAAKSGTRRINGPGGLKKGFLLS